MHLVLLATDGIIAKVGGVISILFDLQMLLHQK